MATNIQQHEMPVNEQTVPPYSKDDPAAIPQPAAAYQPHPQPAYQQNPTYVTTLGRLNEQPDLVDCPFCRKQAMTRVAKEDSTMTMVAGGLLCLVCICLTCLPCMLGWCQNIDHFCSSCGKQLTHKPHDGTVQITEAAKEAQAMNGGMQMGPAPGQMPSQYAVPQPSPYGQEQQQQYGSPGQQHGQHRDMQQSQPEIQVSSPPQSPPVVQEKV